MKLRRLVVNQFKCFTTPTQLGPVGDGLNLVVGPNELGKSTLLDAFRAVLFERYSSKARPIMALQNDRSGAAPVVELAFEVNSGEYTLTKRFVKNTYARLRCPNGQLLEADAAESELRNLLGFAEAGNRGASPETLGMWGVLWVQQGQSFGKPYLPDSALASLSAGLQSEVGTVLGGRRGRELPHVIDLLRGELVTATQRRPRGQYSDSLDHVCELELQLNEQQQQQRDLAETLEQLEAAEIRLKRLEDGSQDLNDQTELSDAQNQLDEVMRYDLRLNAALNELRIREGHLETTQRAQSERMSRRAQLESDRDLLKKESKRLEELQEQEQESLRALDKLRMSVAGAEADVESAMSSEAHWRRILERIARTAELNNLLSRQGDIESAQERLVEAQHRARQIRVTDESLQRIRRSAEIAEESRARLRVAATRITFEIPSNRIAGMEANGAPLTDPPATLEALDPVQITIPERGRILIEPAVADRDQLMHEEREAQVKLRTALSECGANSLADAQILRDQRRDLEVAANAARKELERLAPSGDSMLLQLRIDELRQSLDSTPDEGDTGQLPQRDCAEAALDRVQIDLKEARDKERVARVAVDERARAATTLSAEVRTLQNAVNDRAELIDKRVNQLRSDAEDEPDENLAAATERAEKAVFKQRKIVSALEEERPVSARTQLEARISRLQSVLEQRAESRVELKVECAGLRERIELNDGAGIDESIGHTQHELEQAKRRRDRFERELAVLDLLANTLRAAEREAKERYLAPVIDRVHPYLQMLFPNAEIGMDEDLNITGMSRLAGYEENFDHLSMGTQEQIAVLVRLAFAELLIDQNAPAAVILDDALAFSDDRRMELMFDILAHAAKRVQILIFTCREQLFDGLGARKLQIAKVDPESLRSA